MSNHQREGVNLSLVGVEVIQIPIEINITAILNNDESIIICLRYLL